MFSVPSSFEILTPGNIDDYISIDEYNSYMLLPEGAEAARDTRLQALQAVRSYLWDRVLISEKVQSTFDEICEVYVSGYVSDLVSATVNMLDGTTIDVTADFETVNDTAGNGHIQVVEGASLPYSDKRRSAITFEFWQGWPPLLFPTPIKMAILAVCQRMYASDGLVDVSTLPDVAASIAKWVNYSI